MAHVIIMSGEKKGTRLEVDQPEAVIGRAPENFITLNAPSISGKHCAILKDEERYSIKDLGSTNGTRLNGRTVEESRLKPKDLIMAGEIELMFDGANIEIDQSMHTNTGIFEVETRVDDDGSNPMATSTAFAKKRDYNVLWIVVIVAGSILALAAFAWFLIKLFK